MFAPDRLLALDTFARCGSVARAAAELHRTPSGVSQQLAALEREAGAVLTEPAGRGLRLTPAGRVLAAHAGDILARMGAARAELARLDTDVTGPVRIASIASCIQAIAPRAVAILTARHPGLRVALTDGEAEETLPAVVAGEVDVAVVESWDGLAAPTVPGTRSAVLCHDVVDLVLPAGHRLAGGPPDAAVAVGEVDDLDWIADRPGTRAHDWLVDSLRRAGLEPRVTCHLCGFGMHVELVAGAGVAALVPRLGRPPAPSGVVYRPTEPALGRTVEAVWRSDRGTPAVRAAVAALGEVAGAPGAGGAPRG